MWGNNDYVKAFGAAAHRALSSGILPGPVGGTKPSPIKTADVARKAVQGAGAGGAVRSTPKAMPQATSVGNYYNQINQLSNKIK